MILNALGASSRGPGRGLKLVQKNWFAWTNFSSRVGVCVCVCVCVSFVITKEEVVQKKSVCPTWTHFSCVITKDAHTHTLTVVITKEKITFVITEKLFHVVFKYYKASHMHT